MAKVIEVRTEEKARADQVLADARRNLHIAEKQLELAKADVAAAATAAGDLQTAQKKLQADLCAATMRADQDRLAAALEDNERWQRLANHTVEEAAAAQTGAEQREADLAASVDAAQAAATEAAKAYDDAGKQEELFASWRAGLAAKAVVDAIEAGRKERTVDPYTAARARLERLLGDAAMLDVYRQRAWFAAENAALTGNRLLDAVRKAADARTKSAPLLAKRMTAAAELGVWIDCIQDAAEATLTRLTTSRKVLTDIAAPGDDGEDKEPRKSQLARIDRLAGRAMAVGAPAREKATFDASRTVHEREQALAAAELAALAADPDNSPAVDAERQALEDARATAADADAALTTPVDWLDPDHPNDPAKPQSPKLALDDYELTIPPDLLADVVAFFDAEMAIDRVASVDAADIGQHLDAAEQAYAAAEQADVRERRAVAMVDARVEADRRRLAASAGAAAAHKLLTIRGDR